MKRPELDVMEPEIAYVVLCTCPGERARELARALLREHLAACVNLVPGVESHYWWEGELDQASESLMVIKTSGDRYSELERRLAELHPYDVPEILAIGVESGFEAYLAWLREATRPTEE